MARLYRVEHRQSRKGPYYGCAAIDGKVNEKHPMPKFSIWSYSSEHGRYAFDSYDKLLVWFHDELEVLAAYDFVVRVYDAPIEACDDVQCVFNAKLAMELETIKI